MSAPDSRRAFEKAFGYVERNCLEPRHELRRASDLILPAENSSVISYMLVGDIGIKSLVGEIERGQLTGGLKVSNKNQMSRGFLLLAEGRVYGVIYSDKAEALPKPAKEAIHDVIAQLKDAESSIMMFPLEEPIVVPLSALFVGYPVERNDDYSALEYLDFISNWLEEKSVTATLAISISGNFPATTLAFISKGEFAGYFNVDDVTFKTRVETLRDSLKGVPNAALEVSILPPDFYTDRSSFGFTLSALI